MKRETAVGQLQVCYYTCNCTSQIGEARKICVEIITESFPNMKIPADPRFSVISKYKNLEENDTKTHYNPIIQNF